MSMRIRYSCPHCERRIEHNAALAGQLVICSACKGEFYEPTDPLPGKAAEKALKPKPEEPRVIRVPVGMPGIDNQLAVLGPHTGSGMQSIEELVEAVLLGNAAANPASTPVPGNPTLANPAKPVPAAMPTPKNLASPAKSPAPAALPASAARPAAIPNQPVPKPAAPNQPAQNQPAPKQTLSHKAPIPVEGLAGVTAKQMIDELRRRGLFAVLLTSEAANIAKATIIHSENMTDEDATSFLARYVASLQPDGKKPMKSGIMGRMFGGDK